MKNTKTQIISEKVTKLRGNTKCLYSLVYQLTGNEKENPLPERENNEDLAHQFADYFMNKIQTIHISLKDCEKFHPEQNNDTNQLNQFEPMSEEEVRKIINGMQAKSCEQDAIPTKNLKEILDGVLPTLTRIINASFQQGGFAETWKISIIHPLMKKVGVDLLARNYHPVSNFKFVSKAMKKCVLKQFINHCNHNKLIPDYQSAYHSNYSCETAVIKLVDDILHNMESKKGTALMAIDLSAAFDTVDHDILFSVLHNKFRIRGVALNWFDRPRYCKVCITESYSTHRKLDFSVPEGSWAGANIFNAYTSTLTSVIPRSIDIHGFANDHTLKDNFKIGDNTEERKYITNLENCATEVKNWMDKNRLRMNDEKTEFIMFSS